MTVNRAVRVTGRLLAHELRSLHSLLLWTVRRRHGVPPGAHPASYTEPQTATMYLWISMSAVEAVVFALVIPWPLVHAILLGVHGYGLLLMIAMQAACVTRPHVVGADGSLRLRYAALFDLRIPASVIVGARVDRRLSSARLVAQPAEDVMELVVASQTTVTVELAEPVEFVRPLGRRGRARVLRFHADNPAALVAALNSAADATRAAPGPERTVPSPPRVRAPGGEPTGR
jgi:hypothetical protein